MPPTALVVEALVAVASVVERTLPVVWVDRTLPVVWVDPALRLAASVGR
jgi:hypothetical protein